MSDSESDNGPEPLTQFDALTKPFEIPTINKTGDSVAGPANSQLNVPKRAVRGNYDVLYEEGKSALNLPRVQRFLKRRTTEWNTSAYLLNTEADVKGVAMATFLPCVHNAMEAYVGWDKIQVKDKSGKAIGIETVARFRKGFEVQNTDARGNQTKADVGYFDNQKGTQRGRPYAEGKGYTGCTGNVDWKRCGVLDEDMVEAAVTGNAGIKDRFGRLIHQGWKYGKAHGTTRYIVIDGRFVWFIHFKDAHCVINNDPVTKKEEPWTIRFGDEFSITTMDLSKPEVSKKCPLAWFGFMILGWEDTWTPPLPPDGPRSGGLSSLPPPPPPPPSSGGPPSGGPSSQSVIPSRPKRNIPKKDNKTGGSDQGPKGPGRPPKT